LLHHSVLCKDDVNPSPDSNGYPAARIEDWVLDAGMYGARSMSG